MKTNFYSVIFTFVFVLVSQFVIAQKVIINCNIDSQYYKFSKFPKPDEISCDCNNIYLLTQKQFATLAGKSKLDKELIAEYESAIGQFQSINKDLNTLSNTHKSYLDTLESHLIKQDSLWNKQKALLANSTDLTDKALDKARKYRNRSLFLAGFNIVLVIVLIFK